VDFAARRDAVPAMVDFVAEQAILAGLADRRVAHLRIAVEEIALNISEHAAGGAEVCLGIAVRGDARRFVAELEDDGPAFDPGAAPTPHVDAQLDGTCLGGLGVLLVRRLMDGFHYRRERSRNVVTLEVVDGAPKSRG
jgi:anti-sigma regulatory factor (Ser/Thr protein kinase)